MLKVSVVVATYNRFKDLEECLDSIFEMRVKPHEVIVVDNSSTDGTEGVKASYPIRFFSILERSMVKARNIGISAANGDIVAYVDDDGIVDENWIKYLAQPYEDDNVGGVGGRIIPDGQQKNNHTNVKLHAIGKLSKDGSVSSNFDLFLKRPVDVDHIAGGNMSFRRDLLLRIQGFDENFKGTCFREDADVSARVRKLGYKLVYQPEALVWHKFKGKIVDHKWIYWYTRNHTYFYLKNIFPECRDRFPFFLYRTFFPQKDYMKRSGVKVELNLQVFAYAIRGLLDGAAIQLLKT